MRIALWLVIAVFISTLFWPQLLTNKGILYCFFLFSFLIVLPRLRFLAIIPLSAVYFTVYANLTLTGCVPFLANNIALPFVNNTCLQAYADGQDHTAIVQVNSLISYKNNGYFSANLLVVDGLRLNYSPQLTMYWYNPTLNVQAGQQHAFKVRFKPVYGYGNPAGFDRQKWFFSEHIAYRASIKEHLAIRSPEINFRAYFYQKVQTLTASLNNQGIILALSFADKTLISSAKKEQIKKMAISHLFAISGLHIGLLFSWLYLLLHLLVNWFFPKRYLGWNSSRLLSFGAVMGAFFYAYLAGFSLPTQRAFVMLFLAVIVLSMKRKCALFDLLSVTLLIILLLDPLAVLSLSLWLSFSAVAIILSVLWCFPGIRLPSKEGVTESKFIAIKQYLKFLILIQLALTLLMLPIQLLTFSAFNSGAALINLIAVPLFSLLIIPLVLLGTLFTLIVPQLASLFFSSADYIITMFFSLFAVAEYAYQGYSVFYKQLIVLFISLLVLLFILYFQVPNNRKTNLLFAVIVVLIAGSAFWQKENNRAELWVVEGIDVGQGLAVLIRSQGKTLLYDSGARYPSGYSVAKNTIVPYLNSLAIKQLDYFVISHSDIDHAGGADVIMENFNPKHILLGEPLAINQRKIDNAIFCKAGQKWSLGALSVVVLSPFSLSKKNNNNSCVLQISDAYNALLLTGDIERKQELKLIEKYGKQLASNLLFAPHHGSKHSSSTAFINAVAPQWVIFSAGFMNRWGFPAGEVKLRYKNQSVKMVNSGLSGLIRFKIEKAGIKMQTYREDLAAYWYHHTFSQ